jgi:mRNA interferase RelE/StbE
MEIQFLEDADDDLENLPQKIKDRIVSKIINYAEGKSADVIKLKNRNEFRLRVGDYRVLFMIYSDRLEIIRILHRKEIYEA